MRRAEKQSHLLGEMGQISAKLLREQKVIVFKNEHLNVSKFEVVSQISDPKQKKLTLIDGQTARKRNNLQQFMNVIPSACYQQNLYVTASLVFPDVAAHSQC